jgi:hypothetical protein
VSSARLAGRVFGLFEGGFSFERDLEGCSMSFIVRARLCFMEGTSSIRSGMFSQSN